MLIFLALSFHVPDFSKKRKVLLPPSGRDDAQESVIRRENSRIHGKNSLDVDSGHSDAELVKPGGGF